MDDDVEGATEGDEDDASADSRGKPSSIVFLNDRGACSTLAGGADDGLGGGAMNELGWTGAGEGARGEAAAGIGVPRCSV